MEEHIQTFRRCCNSLRTGVDIVAANTWLSSLIHDRSICLPLCIAVINSADEGKIDDLFLASKLVHNIFREARYKIVIDLSHVHVMMTVLFYKEGISLSSPSTSSAHRQLCLCIAASLLTLSHQPESLQSVLHSLAQLITESESSRLKVVRILEEVPSELDKESSRILSAEHQLLLISLRNILLSIIDNSARTICSTFKQCSDLPEEFLFSYLASNESLDRNNSGHIITLTSQLALCAACLQALSIWGSANCVSSSHLDTTNSNNNTFGSPEKQQLNSDFIFSPIGLTGIYFMTSNCPDNSAENISYFDITYRQARGALCLLKKITRSLHTILNKERENTAGFAQGNTQRIGIVKIVGYENITALLNRLQELVVLSCSIMSEWLLIPSLPSSTSMNTTTMNSPQAVQHRKLVRAMYSIPILIIEAWDVLLLYSDKDRGLLKWQQQLHEFSDSCSQMGQGSGRYPRVSPPFSINSLCGGEFVDPGPLLSALIELTVVFTEKHMMTMFDPITARPGPDFTPQLLDRSSISEGCVESDPRYLLMSCVLCCVGVDRGAALGAFEVVTYLAKTFSDHSIEYLLDRTVRPLLSIVISQCCYAEANGRDRLPQQIFLEYEQSRRMECRGVANRADCLPGDLEEQLDAVLAFRDESVFLLQAILTQWPGGGDTWPILAGLLYKEVSNFRDITANRSTLCGVDAQLNSGAVEGGGIEAAEWAIGRDIECLLFLMTSMMESIKEETVSHSTHSSFPPSSLSHHPSLPPPRPLSSPPSQHLNTFSSPQATRPNPSPSSFHSASTQHNGLSPLSPVTNIPYSKSYFLDISNITLLVLEQSANPALDIQNIILNNYPGIAVRLLQLWTLIPYPGDNSSNCNDGDVSVVLLSVLQFACRAVEYTPHESILCASFELLESATKRFKVHLSADHAYGLAVWLTRSFTLLPVIDFMKRNIQKAAKLYTTLGRVVMLLPDTAADTSRPVRWDFLSSALSSLTSGLQIPLDPIMHTRTLDTPPSQYVMCFESTHEMLSACKASLANLKGFLRGLCEKRSTADEEEEEEEEEEENASDTSQSASDQSMEVLFARIYPQLCGGLLALLESSVAMGATPFGESFWSDKNSVLLSEVVAGVCGTLCSLIDSPSPCRCPLSVLSVCAEQVGCILSVPPVTPHVSSITSVATAIVRQCSDHSEAPIELLSRLPFLCLKRTHHILQCQSASLHCQNEENSTYVIDDDDVCDFEAVLETFRLVRQCCLAFPAVLAGTGYLNSDPPSDGAGNLFFECFYLLLQNKKVPRNGAVSRIMNTVLHSFCDVTKMSLGNGIGRTDRTIQQEHERTILVRTNYHCSFLKYLRPMIATLFFSGLFGDERVLRPFAGYLETFLILYRGNCGFTECDGNLTALLQQVCSKVVTQITAAAAVVQDVVCVGDRLGLGSEERIVLHVPCVNPQVIVMSATQYMCVVFETLLSCFLHGNAIADAERGGERGKGRAVCTARLGYLEVCSLYRTGRHAAQQLDCCVGLQEDMLRKVQVSTCKLVRWPSEAIH